MMPNRQEDETSSEEAIEAEAEVQQVVVAVTRILEEEEIMIITNLEDLIVLDMDIKGVVGNLIVHTEEKLIDPSSMWGKEEMAINQQERIIIVMINKTETGEILLWTASTTFVSSSM